MKTRSSKKEAELEDDEAYARIGRAEKRSEAAFARGLKRIDDNFARREKSRDAMQEKCRQGLWILRLQKFTFSIHHNPNCKSPFEVRLVGPSAGKLDNLPGADSKDIRGYGRSLDEAARDAWQQKFGKR